MLPQIAAGEFDDFKVLQLPLLFVREKFPYISVAWNPRLVEVRKIVQQAVEDIQASHYAGESSGASRRPS